MPSADDYDAAAAAFDAVASELSTLLVHVIPTAAMALHGGRFTNDVRRLLAEDEREVVSQMIAARGAATSCRWQAHEMRVAEGARAAEEAARRRAVAERGRVAAVPGAR